MILREIIIFINVCSRYGKFYRFVIYLLYNFEIMFTSQIEVKILKNMNLRIREWNASGSKSFYLHLKESVE